MKSLQHYIDQMNQLMNELIQIATQLRDMSFQVISEEDLAPLQKRQEEILVEIEQIEQLIKKNYKNQMQEEVQESFRMQLQNFQKLNQEFIQNLNASHGLIQFELRRMHEEEKEIP